MKVWRSYSMGVNRTRLWRWRVQACFPSDAVMALVIWCWFERPALKQAFELIRLRGLQAICAILIASVVIWAGYRFSFGKTQELSFSVPAPELFTGIQEVRKHNES